jgi:hypothetical protein
VMPLAMGAFQAHGHEIYVVATEPGLGLFPPEVGQRDTDSTFRFRWAHAKVQSIDPAAYCARSAFTGSTPVAFRAGM